MTYTNILGYEPEPGAIFVMFKTSGGDKTITRRFDPAHESRWNYPRTIKAPSFIDAAEKLHCQSGVESLLRYSGKRWNIIR
ncbi:MAG: hypothetical protein GY774_35585 [Planctomycetes bacterium]|nr:hypothetical protein [Planctomycetota bacterium]